MPEANLTTIHEYCHFCGESNTIRIDGKNMPEYDGAIFDFNRPYIDGIRCHGCDRAFEIMKEYDFQLAPGEKLGIILPGSPD